MLPLRQIGALHSEAFVSAVGMENIKVGQGVFNVQKRIMYPFNHSLLPSSRL